MQQTRIHDTKNRQRKPATKRSVKSGGTNGELHRLTMTRLKVGMRWWHNTRKWAACMMRFQLACSIDKLRPITREGQDAEVWRTAGWDPLGGLCGPPPPPPNGAAPRHRWPVRSQWREWRERRDACGLGGIKVSSEVLRLRACQRRPFVWYLSSRARHVQSRSFDPIPHTHSIFQFTSARLNSGITNVATACQHAFWLPPFSRGSSGGFIAQPPPSPHPLIWKSRGRIVRGW